MEFTLSRLESLCLGCATDATVEPPERNALLVLLNVGQVFQCLGHFEASNGSSGFPSVFEVLRPCVSFRKTSHGWHTTRR
jgi:hypothetical protein